MIRAGRPERFDPLWFLFDLAAENAAPVRGERSLLYSGAANAVRFNGALDVWSRVQASY